MLRNTFFTFNNTLENIFIFIAICLTFFGGGKIESVEIFYYFIDKRYRFKID